MKATPTESGRVVIATQGHDAGRWYVILRMLDERNALLCDGHSRKLDKPKKKQIKHLRALPLSVAVDGRGGSGGKIADSDIRKALLEARNAYETKTAGAPMVARQEKEECAFVQE